jgi:porin
MLWEDKISVKIGRFATGDDFASSPIYWLYMNNGIDGNPQALPVNTQFSAYPWRYGRPECGLSRLQNAMR